MWIVFFQMADVGSQTSRLCPAQWIDLKTAVNQVECGTEYSEAVWAQVAAKLAPVTRCTLMGLERGKREPFR